MGLRVEVGNPRVKGASPYEDGRIGLRQLSVYCLAIWSKPGSLEQKGDPGNLGSRNQIQ
ncbi:hypothetical protein SBA4_6230002 [Candidatus Sulfopaludibacter sp. SbA4]|nr:hypothetical protein SBA4_6230002 [Candidatus Sulfopaludibacter sp. SbA4]